MWDRKDEGFNLFDKRDNTDEVLWTTIEKVDKDYRDVCHMVILVGERKMCDRCDIDVV